MYRDPSKFRERFKAYKDGKSVREIYGLPGYVGGKSSSAVDDTADFLRLYEGFKEKTYLDGKGIPTIGYGFTDAKFVNKGRITRAEAETELKRQIAVRLAELRRKLGPQVWDSLSNDSKKALTSYHFNYPAGFKDNTKFMLYWRAGRYSDAIKEVDAGWNDPDNPGLRTRRIAELKLLRSDPALFSRPIPEKPSDVTILRPDVLRVATTIPQEKTIPIADPRNATIAEALRAMWAHTAFENMPKVSDMPIWESPSLPALTPIEYDVTPLKMYAGGKLPGYQNGTILQGHKQIPIDNARTATEPDYTKDGWLLGTLKRGANNFIKTVEYFTDSARRVLNGRGSTEDKINVALDLGGATGAKAIAKVIRKARVIKPPKASAKFKTNNPNEVGNYYRKHPEEVTPIVNSPELQNAIKFTEEYTAPRYAKMNKVLIGIDPASIKLGSADFSGTNLGAITGPDGEIILNNSVLGNSQLMEDILAHEFGGHWVNLKYPITPQQASMILYGLPFKLSFLNSHPGFNLTEEGLAVYRSLLNIASRDFGITGKQLDEFMSRPPEAWLRRTLPRLGYGNAIDWKLPDLLPLGQMSRIVPAAGAGIYLAGNEYKNGKLPGYKIGRNPSNAKINSDGTFTDDYTKLFDDMYVTPDKVDLKRSSHTLNNFPEYLANRTAWMLTFMPAAVLNDKPLERVYPEFDVIFGGRLLTTELAPTMVKALRYNDPWDKHYFLALELGDLKGAQNLRDAHFRIKSPDTKVTDPQYHTVDDAYNPNWNRFNKDIENINASFYTSSNPYVSGTYSKELVSDAERDFIIETTRQNQLKQMMSYRNNQHLTNPHYWELVDPNKFKKYALNTFKWLDSPVNPKRQKKVYLNIKNPFTLDAKGKWWSLFEFEDFPKEMQNVIRPNGFSIYRPWSTRAIDEAYQKLGYDSAILKNLVDIGGNKRYISKPIPSTIIETADPKNIKYYDAVTYDDFGNIIPLSKRDDFRIDDLRYQDGKLPGYSNGKIRIKPANRGKFNATKKRTGKTTEELTHSKNPLTRKRAIFAQNAKKWNHK